MHEEEILYKDLGAGGVDLPGFWRVIQERGHTYWVTLDLDPPRPNEGEGSPEDKLRINKRFLEEVLHVEHLYNSVSLVAFCIHRCREGIGMIETTRLLLRSMCEADTDDLLAIFADPAVMTAFAASPFNRAQMERWVRRNMDHQSAHGYGLFSVILKARGLLIGNCGLEQMEIAGAHVAELGYDFRRDYWHQGFATEAATAVRDYAFQTLALPRLVSMIRQGNAASRRVAERVGMHRDAECLRYGQPYWIYGLRRDEMMPP